MNHTTHAIHAVRIGLRRGWAEFTQSLRSIQDQIFYLVMAGGILVYLWFNRTNEIGDTGLLLPQFVMPSILGGMIAFTVVIGPAYALAQEREDGTLLRMRAVPGGIVGYHTGQLLLHSLNIIPMMLVILIPGALLFDDVMPATASGWLTVAWVLLLGMLATLPIGIVIGSLVPNAQKVATWGMVPTMGLTGVSGLFFPLQQLWDWVQAVAQVFPMYWIGLGMRSAFLPDEFAATVEIGGSWRTLPTVAVLAGWAIAGGLATPTVLRRMAQRQSGSAVAAARESAVTQGVR